jgi:hypothetical protein
MNRPSAISLPMPSRTSNSSLYVDAALPLMKKAGIDEEDIDDGCVEISSSETAGSFVKTCRKLRYWWENRSQRAARTFSLSTAGFLMPMRLREPGGFGPLLTNLRQLGSKSPLVLIAMRRMGANESGGLAGLQRVNRCVFPPSVARRRAHGRHARHRCDVPAFRLTYRVSSRKHRTRNGRQHDRRLLERCSPVPTSKGRKLLPAHGTDRGGKTMAGRRALGFGR